MTRGMFIALALWAHGAVAAAARAEDGGPAADDPTDAARPPTEAEQLFRDGRDLGSQGRWQEACPLLERSQALDPAVGTQFNLGYCHEEIGKLASAERHYREVERALRLTGNHEEADRVLQRLDAVARRVLKLRIDVATEVRIAGLAVTRSGEPIPPSQWGRELPIDPGDYLLEATAPNRKPWRRRVEARGEGHVVAVNVTPLEPVATRRQGTDSASPKLPPSGWTIAGWTAAAVGVVGVALGTGFAFDALAKRNEADDNYCIEKGVCDEQGIGLYVEAQDSAKIANAGFIGGGIALSAGIAMLVVGALDDSPAAASHAGVTVVGGRSLAGVAGVWLW